MARNSTPSLSAKAKSWAAAPLVSGKSLSRAQRENGDGYKWKSRKVTTRAASGKSNRSMLEKKGLENKVGAMFVYSPYVDFATNTHSTGVKVRGSW